MFLFAHTNWAGHFQHFATRPNVNKSKSLPHHWAQTYGGIHHHPQSREHSWLGPTTASPSPINHQKYGLMTKKWQINGLQWFFTITLTLPSCTRKIWRREQISDVSTKQSINLAFFWEQTNIFLLNLWCRHPHARYAGQWLCYWKVLVQDDRIWNVPYNDTTLYR